MIYILSETDRYNNDNIESSLLYFVVYTKYRESYVVDQNTYAQS